MIEALAHLTSFCRWCFFFFFLLLSVPFSCCTVYNYVRPSSYIFSRCGGTTTNEQKQTRKRVGISGMKAPAREGTEIYDAEGKNVVGKVCTCVKCKNLIGPRAVNNLLVSRSRARTPLSSNRYGLPSNRLAPAVRINSGVGTEGTRT